MIRVPASAHMLRIDRAKAELKPYNESVKFLRRLPSSPSGVDPGRREHSTSGLFGGAEMGMKRSHIASQRPVGFESLLFGGRRWC